MQPSLVYIVQIEGANKGGGQKFRNIMQTPPAPHSEGYVSNFVEIFAWIMTMPGYEALWELQRPHINPYAWGYDFWYHGYASRKAVAAGHCHRMGIVSTMRMQHVQGVERTDGTAVKVKWNAVLAQERHFKRYGGVDLGRCPPQCVAYIWNGSHFNIYLLLHHFLYLYQIKVILKSH